MYILCTWYVSVWWRYSLICTSAKNLSLHTIYSNITYIIYTYFILCHLCHTHTHSKIVCSGAYLICWLFILSIFILFNMHNSKEFFTSHHQLKHHIHHIHTYINHVIFITLILTQQFFAVVHILHIYSSYSLLSYFSICTSAKNVSSHTTSSKFVISLTYVSHFRPTAIYSNLLAYFHKITLIYTSFPVLDLVPFSLGLNGSLKPSKTRSKKNKKKRSNTL